MGVLGSKKALLTVAITAVFAVGAFLVVFFTLGKRSDKQKSASWQVTGATIDNQYAIKGTSEGFDEDKACASLTNRGRNLPVTLKKAKAGPPDVYREEGCGSASNVSPGTGVRSGLLGFAQIGQCAKGTVLRPGESCILGLRAVSDGQPMGDLDLSTEVVCETREIEPCQLLRKDLKPTKEAPLALTVDQRSKFPRTASGFQITTEKARMVAAETQPGAGPSGTEPAPGPGTREPARDQRPATNTVPPGPAPEQSKTETRPAEPGNGGREQPERTEPEQQKPEQQKPEQQKPEERKPEEQQPEERAPDQAPPS